MSSRELIPVPSSPALPPTSRQTSLTMSASSNISFGGTQIYHSVEDSSQHIIARSQEEINRRIHGMIRTKAYKMLIQKIKKGQSWTVITGSPGEGKTILAYFITSYFQEKDFDVYIIKSKEEYFSIRQFGSKTVLMLNDIFGAFAFDAEKLDDWLIVLGDLEQFTEGNGSDNDSHFHVVLTMRNYVLKAAIPHLDRFSSMFNAIDLTVDVPLDKDEKKDILRCHLKRKNIRLPHEQTTIEKICEFPTVHGFPHCCQMFSNFPEAHENPLKFFSRPLFFLNNTIMKLMQNEKVKRLFYALLNNKDCCLRKTDTKGDEYVKKMSREDIVDASSDLVDSYITEHHNTLFISHPSILWSIVYVIGCRDPEFVIRVCPLHFINELFVLPADLPLSEAISSRSSPTIVIEEGCQSTLLDRFVKETSSNNLKPVLSHQAFSCKEFAGNFLSSMTEHHSLKQLIALRDAITLKPFLQLVTSNKSAVLLKLISMTQPFDADEQKYTLLGCCEFGSAGAFHILTEKYPELKIDVTDENKRSPLSLAAQSGNKDIVELLLPKVNIHAKDNMGMNSLHWSIDKGQTDVAYLLLESGIEVNEPDSIGRSALHYASWGGNQEAVCFLLTKGAKVNAADVDGTTPLHDACYRGYEHVADRLIKAGSDINKQNIWSETPLCIAVTHGNKSVVRCLLRSGCDISLKNGNHQTAEDIARKYNHEEILESLLRHQTKR